MKTNPNDKVRQGNQVAFEQFRSFKFQSFDGLQFSGVKEIIAEETGDTDIRLEIGDDKATLTMSNNISDKIQNKLAIYAEDVFATSYCSNPQTDDRGFTTYSFAEGLTLDDDSIDTFKEHFAKINKGKKYIRTQYVEWTAEDGSKLGCFCLELDQKDKDNSRFEIWINTEDKGLELLHQGNDINNVFSDENFNKSINRLNYTIEEAKIFHDFKKFKFPRFNNAEFSGIEKYGSSGNREMAVSWEQEDGSKLKCYCFENPPTENALYEIIFIKKGGPTIVLDNGNNIDEIFSNENLTKCAKNYMQGELIEKKHVKLTNETLILQHFQKMNPQSINAEKHIALQTMINIFLTSAGKISQEDSANQLGISEFDTEHFHTQYTKEFSQYRRILSEVTRKDANLRKAILDNKISNEQADEQLYDTVYGAAERIILECVPITTKTPLTLKEELDGVKKWLRYCDINLAKHNAPTTLYTHSEVNAEKFETNLEGHNVILEWDNLTVRLDDTQSDGNVASSVAHRLIEIGKPMATNKWNIVLRKFESVPDAFNTFAELRGKLQTMVHYEKQNRIKHDSKKMIGKFPISDEQEKKLSEGKSVRLGTVKHNGKPYVVFAKVGKNSKKKEIKVSHVADKPKQKTASKLKTKAKTQQIK